jgi:hypothetical protein
MSRLSEIYAGWKNFTFPNPIIEQEAKRRIEICVVCPELTKRNSCKLCGCYMPAKVRSPKSRCKNKKW